MAHSMWVGRLARRTPLPRGGVEDPNMRGATPSNDHRQLGGLDTPPSNYHRQLGGLDPPPSNYH